MTRARVATLAWVAAIAALAGCGGPSALPPTAPQEVAVSGVTRSCPRGSAWDGTRCVLGRADDAGPPCDGEWSGSVCVTKVEVTCPAGMRFEGGKCVAPVANVRGAWTVPARQPGSKSDARQHFLQGTQFYASGDYADALAEFETAYAIAPTPAVLMNIAACLESLGRLADALDVLERFIAESPPGSAAVTKAMARASALRARLGGGP